MALLGQIRRARQSKDTLHYAARGIGHFMPIAKLCRMGSRLPGFSIAIGLPVRHSLTTHSISRKVSS